MALRQVVATVTLVGLGPGAPVWADDTDPQIARWLRGGQLRYLDPSPQPEVEQLADAVIIPKPQREGELRSSTSPAPPEPPVEVKPRRAPAKKVQK